MPRNDPGEHTPAEEELHPEATDSCRAAAPGPKRPLDIQTPKRYSSRMRLPRIMLLLLTAAVGTGCVANKDFYAPTSHIYPAPARFGLRYEDVTFPSKDGTKLTGWFIRGFGQVPKGTVIHFHGNAKNMANHFPAAAWLPKYGFNVLTFDYRGYGRSEGKPSPGGLYLDCLGAIEYVKSRKDVDPDKLVLFGQSLGAANAITLVGKPASELKPLTGIRAVLADSSFYSYRSIAAGSVRQFPLVSLFRKPLAFLIVDNRYSPERYISFISPIPILLIHGDSDDIVPINHSEKLFKMAKAPKTLWKVTGGRHIDAILKHPRTYQPRIARFFLDAIAKPLPQAPTPVSQE